MNFRDEATRRFLSLISYFISIDTVRVNEHKIQAAKAFSDHYLALCNDDRASGKIVQLEFGKIQLQRPETPQSSGLRKTFDQSRPDTMESKFNGDSPRSDDGAESRVEIGIVRLENTDN